MYVVESWIYIKFSLNLPHTGLLGQKTLDEVLRFVDNTTITQVMFLVYDKHRKPSIARKEASTYIHSGNEVFSSRIPVVFVFILHLISSNS